MTNNGTKSRREYVKKCQDLGFGGDHKDIFTTSYLCAKYLQNQGFNKKVYLFGNKVCSYTHNYSFFVKWVSLKQNNVIRPKMLCIYRVWVLSLMRLA